MRLSQKPSEVSVLSVIACFAPGERRGGRRGLPGRLRTACAALGGSSCASSAWTKQKKLRDGSPRAPKPYEVGGGLGGGIFHYRGFAPGPLLEIRRASIGICRHLFPPHNFSFAKPLLLERYSTCHACVCETPAPYHTGPTRALQRAGLGGLGVCKARTPFEPKNRGEEKFSHLSPLLDKSPLQRARCSAHSSCERL